MKKVISQIPKKEILFVLILIPLLILLAYKTAVVITPLSESQQLSFNFLNDPTNYEEQLRAFGATDLEVIHMYDVISVMKTMNIVFYLLLLIGTLMITFYKKNKEIISKMCLWGGISTIVTPIIILLFTLINFNFVFTIFHNIFFPQGNWQFPYESFLIQTFPLSFFIAMTLKIIIFTVLYASIFIFVHLYIKYVHKSSRN